MPAPSGDPFQVPHGAALTGHSLQAGGLMVDLLEGGCKAHRPAPVMLHGPIYGLRSHTRVPIQHTLLAVGLAVGDALEGGDLLRSQEHPLRTCCKTLARLAINPWPRKAWEDGLCLDVAVGPQLSLPIQSLD